MVDEQFNKDMDAYIRNQRKKQKSVGSVDIAVNKGSTDDVKASSGFDSGRIVEYEEHETLWDRILSFFVGGYEEEEEPQRPRDELTAREKKRLAKMRGTDVDVEEVSDEEFDEYEDVEDMDVPEPTFFDKLLQFFGFGERMYEDAAEEAYQEMEDFDPDAFAEEESERMMWEEDVKEVMRIAHNWIEELPDEKKKEFKESADFARYRELLDKLNLLKK